MIDWEKEAEDRLALTKKERASVIVPLKYLDSLALMLIAEKLDELVELELRKEKQPQSDFLR